MSLAKKEAKFRLGDLYDKKVKGNPTLLFCKKNQQYKCKNNKDCMEYPHYEGDKYGTYWKESKNKGQRSGEKEKNGHLNSFLKKDLNFLASCLDEDLEIPIGFGDRDQSNNGYVFSYARSNGDNCVGLLNDHWQYRADEFINNITLLQKFYNVPLSVIKHAFGQRIIPKNQRQHYFDWAKKHIDHPELMDLDNLTAEILTSCIVKTKKFKHKESILFWGGAQTKGFNSFQKEQGYKEKAVERHLIIEHFKENPSDYINISFENKPPKNFMPPHLKDFNHRIAMIQSTLNYANIGHKYLIELQGNDIGSNVYWIYSKDCVVFRPDFLKSHSAWDCHLEPWVHYVPFDHANYDDLVDKIKWCEKNTDKCEEITNNANKLHKLMYDTKHRTRVYSIVLKKIKQNLI